MSLELSLQASDRSHLVKYLDSLEANVPIQERLIAKKYHACRVVINYTALCRDLINLGCTPAKSLTLTFPTEDILPDKYLNHFIRGYFDGDGGVSYTENYQYHKAKNNTYLHYSYVCYFCGNKRFLLDLQRILSLENIKVSPISKDKRSNNHEIRIYERENIQNFRNYIYKNSTICLSRKLDKFFYVDNNMDLKINQTRNAS